MLFNSFPSYQNYFDSSVTGLQHWLLANLAYTVALFNYVLYALCYVERLVSIGIQSFLTGNLTLNAGPVKIEVPLICLFLCICIVFLIWLRETAKAYFSRFDALEWSLSANSENRELDKMLPLVYATVGRNYIASLDMLSELHVFEYGYIAIDDIKPLLEAIEVLTQLDSEVPALVRLAATDVCSAATLTINATGITMHNVRQWREESDMGM